MTAPLHHRGPDDEGVWLDSGAGVALGHRRLAVLDLSPSGHQPMMSAGGRYVVVFNGEIYNHLDLRKHLAFPARDNRVPARASEVPGVDARIQKLCWLVLRLGGSRKPFGVPSACLP